MDFDLYSQRLEATLIIAMHRILQSTDRHGIYVVMNCDYSLLTAHYVILNIENVYLYFKRPRYSHSLRGKI